MRDLHELCRLLWDAACDADPKLRDYQRGDTVRHGTRYAYDWHGCRCDECAERNRDRVRRQRRAAGCRG